MKKYLSELIGIEGHPGEPIKLQGVPVMSSGKKRVNILALGDVGGTLLTGLKLLGGSQLDTIGIYDVNPKVLARYEYEMNQTSYPFEYENFPLVKILEERDLFDCDAFVFCASRAVPDIESQVDDVRMAQYAANKSIVEYFAAMAGERGFKGLFAVVSDPVDPLCKAALLGSTLEPWQIQGFGLGVMNSRAAYYAKKNQRYKNFLTDGRAFGPHGEDLVIADSIEQYDDTVSKELTKLTVEANLKTREIGFKPYIAPALSSGAISILLTISGEWHYSSNYLEKRRKGAFLGAKNRFRKDGLELENLLLPEILFERIKKAYTNLVNL